MIIEVEQRHEVLEQRGLSESGHVTSLHDHSDGLGQKFLRRGAPILTGILVVCSVAGVLPLPTANLLIGGA